MDVERRNFLRGRGDVQELRPPWLLRAATFTEDCTRCGKCIELCPERILSAGDGGFPRVEFGHGECTFCGECTTECEADLFDAQRRPAWTHRAQIGDRCLADLGVMCRSCEDACEPRAIRFVLAVGVVPGPIVDTGACTGCGACIRPCPEQTISMTSGE